MKLGLCGWWLVVCCLGAGGQEIRLEGGAAPARQFVTLASEAVEVPAGRPAWVEVRFRVEAGKHINSHAPHDELLVPTVLTLSGVKVTSEAYPEGVPMRLEGSGGDEVLSTYQGEFRVRVEMVAAKGDSVLTGVLRYQACDARSCFPPRSLPVRVMVLGR